MGFLIFFPFVSTFVAVFMFVAVIYLIMKAVLYLVQCFGLYRIAREENYKYPMIACIPVVCDYVLGRFCLGKANSIGYCVLSLIGIGASYVYSTTSNEILGCAALAYRIVYFLVDMAVMREFYRKVYKKPKVFTVCTVATFGLLKPIFIVTSGIRKLRKTEDNCERDTE